MNHTPKWRTRSPGVLITGDMAFEWTGITVQGYPFVEKAETIKVILNSHDALVAACRAGAAYSDALLSLQEQHPTLMGTIIESADLDPLFKDWHDKTHAVLNAPATAGEAP